VFTTRRSFKRSTNTVFVIKRPQNLIGKATICCVVLLALLLYFDEKANSVAFRANSHYGRTDFNLRRMWRKGEPHFGVVCMPLVAHRSQSRMSGVNVEAYQNVLVFGFQWHDWSLRGADTYFSIGSEFSLLAGNMAELDDLLLRLVLLAEASLAGVWVCIWRPSLRRH